MIKKKMFLPTKKICFISNLDFETKAPQPASKDIPDWYKQMSSYSELGNKPDGNGSIGKTIKKCMPVFDVITAGYLFYTHGDIYVSQKEGVPWYEWTGVSIIEWHTKWQVSKHPQMENKNHDAPKFINPWTIITPKGYSTLFIPPAHRDSPFQIFEGVVDTDTYKTRVNFPFVLKEPSFEGLIPAGTVIAQAIPFKRENWESEIGSEEDKKTDFVIAQEIRQTFNNYYRNKFWVKKAYK